MGSLASERTALICLPPSLLAHSYADHLAGNDDFHAAILLTPSGSAVVGDWIVLAKSFRRDCVSRKTLGDQEIANGFRALLRKLQVVICRARGIRVTLDGEV